MKKSDINEHEAKNKNFAYRQLFLLAFAKSKLYALMYTKDNPNIIGKNMLDPLHLKLFS